MTAGAGCRLSLRRPRPLDYGRSRRPTTRHRHRARSSRHCRRGDGKVRFAEYHAGKFTWILEAGMLRSDQRSTMARRSADFNGLGEVVVHSADGRKLETLRARLCACIAVEHIVDSANLRSVLAWGFGRSRMLRPLKPFDASPRAFALLPRRTMPPVPRSDPTSIGLPRSGFPIGSTSPR